MTTNRPIARLRNCDLIPLEERTGFRFGTNLRLETERIRRLVTIIFPPGDLKK